MCNVKLIHFSPRIAYSANMMQILPVFFLILICNFKHFVLLRYNRRLFACGEKTIV